MKKGLIALVCAALVCAAAAAVLFRDVLFLPAWVQWQQRQIVCEGEAAPDRFELRGRRALARASDTVLWRSDAALRVQDILWCDVDRDGAEELLLLCWRRGRYGESRPFWVEHDEKSWSQHIYIYDWTAHGPRPRWMASDIGLDAAQWRFDGTRLLITDRTGAVSAWQWVSWGLRQVALPDAEA